MTQTQEIKEDILEYDLASYSNILQFHIFGHLLKRSCVGDVEVLRMEEVSLFFNGNSIVLTRR